MGKIIFRFQQIEELHIGEQNTEWVRYFPKITQTINKHKENPEVIDSMHDLPLMVIQDMFILLVQ